MKSLFLKKGLFVFLLTPLNFFFVKQNKTVATTFHPKRGCFRSLNLFQSHRNAHSFVCCTKVSTFVSVLISFTRALCVDQSVSAEQLQVSEGCVESFFFEACFSVDTRIVRPPSIFYFRTCPHLALYQMKIVDQLIGHRLYIVA